ncbi:hypothetical protein [Micromonospora sp. NPDC005707]|uniref:hypothetical protein n=1 Tax=Micromonospora sp. NPDC005707 TaxID=3157050 RepID=UPI003403CA3D
MITAGTCSPLAFAGRRSGERLAGRLSPRCVDGLVAILLAASATTAIVTAARN